MIPILSPILSAILWTVCRQIGLPALLPALSAPVVWAQEPEQVVEDRIRQEIMGGQIDPALGLAQEAVKQYPNASDLQQLLGIAEFKKGMNQEAREALGRAIELDPRIPENYYNLALVDLSDNRYDKAAVSLEQYLRFTPPNQAQARLLLGRAYQNLNRTEPAIEQFKRALALSPRLPLAHYHLGFAYQSQGNLKEALGEFEKEMALNPSFYDAYWLAGNIELGQGDLGPAEDLFRRAIRLRPQAVPAHYGRARVRLARKDLAGAEAELLKALTLDPGNVEAHYTLARTYQQMGRLDAAQRELAVVAALHEHERGTAAGIAARH